MNQESNNPQRESVFAQAYLATLLPVVEQLVALCKASDYSLFVTIASKLDAAKSCEVRGTMAGPGNEIPEQLVACDQIIRHGFVAVPLDFFQAAAEMLLQGGRPDPAATQAVEKIVLSTH